MGRQGFVQVGKELNESSQHVISQMDLDGAAPRQGRHDARMNTLAASTSKPVVTFETVGRRFALNLSYGLAGKGAHFAVGLFLVGYVLRHLGPERFGLVVVATTLVALLGLIQSGAAAGLGRHLNILHTTGEWEKRNACFAAGTFLAILASAVMVGGLVLFLTALDPMESMPVQRHREGHWVLALLGVAAVLSCLTLPALAGLQAAHRIDIPEKIGLAATLLRAGAVVVSFEYFGATPIGYAAVLLGEQLAVSGANWLCLHRCQPGLKLSFAKVSPTLLREVAGFNALNLLANVNYVAFMQAPAFVLQRAEGLAMAGLYGVGLQLNNLVRGPLTAVMNALAPIVNSLHGGGQRAKLLRLFVLTQKCFLAAATVLWVLFHFLGAAFLELWLHRPMAALIRALPWIIGASAIGVAGMPSSIFSVALGRVKLPAAAGAMLAAVMTLCMVVGPRVGQQDALTHVSILLAVFFGAYQVLRTAEVVCVLGIRSGDFLWSCLRAMTPAAAAGMILLSASFFWPLNSIGGLAGGGLLALAAAGASAHLLLTRDEWTLLNRMKAACCEGTGDRNNV
jgi:O-antigen/teichoic acid export membrane protein